MGMGWVGSRMVVVSWTACWPWNNSDRSGGHFAVKSVLPTCRPGRSDRPGWRVNPLYGELHALPDEPEISGVFFAAREPLSSDGNHRQPTSQCRYPEFR